jgi:hypothetical protein
LLVSLFLPWYGEEIRPPKTGLVLYRTDQYTGWEAFEIADLLLAAGALAALIAVGFRAMRDRSVLLLGIALAVLVGAELVNEPPVMQVIGSYQDLSADRRGGAWVALGAALAMCLGAAVLSRARSAED